MADSELFKIDDLGEKVVKLGINEINNNPDEECFDIVKLKEADADQDTKRLHLEDFEIKKVF